MPFHKIKSRNFLLYCRRYYNIKKLGHQRSLFKDKFLHEFKRRARSSKFHCNSSLLSSFKGKWVVLFFYPLDFTFVCPTEITAFSDEYDKFSALYTEILGVSVDSKHCHLAWIQTPRNEGGIGDINYPLVSDLKREICQAYNVLNDDGEADRGLFLINPEGIVMHTTVNKAPVGRNVEETLRILQGYQYVAANPDEVCPANWTPGEKTMLEDPKGSKEYFSAL